MTDRRKALGGLALAGTSALAIQQTLRDRVPKKPRPPSRVAVLRCESYEKAYQVVWDGLKLLAPAVRGKSVLLKPNLVEYSATAPINTHPTIIAAAVDSLYRLGAATVTVGEGPGHVRDTELLLEECGLRSALREVGLTRFVDLNYDEVHRVKTTTRLTGLSELWLPRTVLAADVLISMPKIKTHHWAGVTLSMKNLFGVVPGSVYGWPKNVLHWQGIDNSIVELASTIPIHYVIADGIVAMKGNGPLHGYPVNLGCLVFADDPVAADAQCCDLLGLSLLSICHLKLCADLGLLRFSKLQCCINFDGQKPKGKE
jgi:uncharacterized protein (DUF362 family)